MYAIPTPSPFPAATGFSIVVGGGTPPYAAVAQASPPNPPGVQVSAGPPYAVTVDPAPPDGSVVTVDVTDSSRPPQVVRVAVARA